MADVNSVKTPFLLECDIALTGFAIITPACKTEQQYRNLRRSFKWIFTLLCNLDNRCIHQKQILLAIQKLTHSREVSSCLERTPYVLQFSRQPAFPS